MRLLEFRPQGYRNLRDLPVVFTLNPDEQPDDNCSIRFLVGVNGTGKSNLLRFLAAIFAALDEGYRHPRPDNPAYSTPFRLAYQLRGSTITLTSTGQGRTGVTVAVNDKRYDPGDLPGRDLILPRALIIYTSGDVNAWRSLLQTPPFLPESEPQELPDELLPDEEYPPDWQETTNEQKAISGETTKTQEAQSAEDDLRTGEERVLPVEPEHLPLALLTALVYHQAGQKRGNGADFELVLKQIGVRRLLGFSLLLTPGSQDLTRQQRESLAKLYSLSTFPLAPLAQQEERQQLWAFDLDDVRDSKPLPAGLIEAVAPEPFQFFRTLVELQEVGILQQVNLAVAKQHPLGGDQPDRTLLAESLSDGELAFLERMALIHLLKENECLFLFDEPETHFNDTWKRDLVNHVEQTLAGTNSEVILTTHASITLTDAYPHEVILLSHRGQEQVPLTLAAEPGEILRTVFEADRSVGRRAIKDITRAIEHGETADLETLLDQVGPGYFRFKIVEELRRRVSSHQ